MLGWHSAAWEKINANLKTLLIAFIIGTPIFISFYNLVWINVIKGDEVNDVLLAIGMFGYSAMRVIGLLTVLALANRFFTSRSKALGYFSDAVYPFYILHQTIILVVGYYLTKLNFGPLLEASLLILSTILGCLILFELIRRVEILRPCFGLKMQASYSPPIVKMGYILGAVLITPLAWKLVF